MNTTYKSAHRWTGLTGLVTAFVLMAFGGLAAHAAPVITPPSSVTVVENGSTTADIGVTDTASIFTVTTTATSSKASLITTASLTFSGAGTNRLLSIRPVQYQYGTATITIVAKDATSKATNTFTVNVTQTNFPPTFTTAIPNQTINENSSSASLAFSVTQPGGSVSNVVVTGVSTNTTLVPNANIVVTGNGTNRTVKFTPGTNQNGEDLIYLVATNAGGAAATNTIYVNVHSVNQPPTFTLATNREVSLENAGVVTLSNFVSNVTSGPTNQSSESNWFVLSYPTNFFAQSPALDTNETFSFEIATNTFGTNTITFVLQTDGSTTNGGKNALTNVLTLAVPFVNQAPSFSLTTNLLLVGEETVSVTNALFLTNISVGPTNESRQTNFFTLTTATTNSTNAAFAVLPAISTNGTLTFKPAPHSFGTNEVTIVMTDSGGTNNGGINTATNTFNIGIVQTNHAPVIVGATNRTILENATNGTASIQLWDYDIDGTNLVLNATSLETNIATVSVSATNTPGASNVTFTITYVPVTNQNGAATIQLVGTEGALSTTNTFVLTVIPVTQPPQFTLQTNLLLVGEETVAVTNVGFATNLAAGPTNQLGEKWAFNLSTATTNSTNANFAVLPAMATNGTLTFKPLAHTFGTNTVTVVMTNSGSTTNGGIVATTNTFLIGIVQTNHAPTIVGATNRTILENATNGTASIQLWDYDIDGTNLVLNATSLETNIATVSVSATNTPGASNVTFTITYVPVTNQNGAATIQLVGTEGALSTTNTFVLTVIPVTQPPRFTLQTNLLLVGEETVAVTNVGFATNLAAGPTNQLGQTWAFNLSTVTTNSTNASFAVLPAMATNGTLTFKPLAHTFGTNTVTVVMTNSGSVTNGGVVATTNTFLIGIVQTNHAPTIVGATNRTILENATNGTASIQLWDYDIDGTNLVLNATSLETNIATVSVSATNTPGASNVTFTITYVPVTNQNGAATIQLVGTEGALSTTNTFVLTVIPVTQPPRFTLQTNVLLVGEETVAVTNVGFATNLAAGPTNQLGQTWAFNLSTATTNSTNASFAVLPAMATNGTLTFKPLAHTFGTNTVTVVMTNSGSTTNGGVVATTNSFLIGIVQTNHAPTIVGATNRTILENATNGTASIQLWDYDIDGTNLVLNATSLETNIATVSVSATNTPGASNVTFTITYVPVTNQNGAATIQLVGTEGALSTTNTFVLTVIPVTQPPRFTLQTNVLLVGEETVAVTNIGFATNLAAGPTNQLGQTWAFNLSTATTNSTNASFAVLPAMATNGTLTFKPLAHTFGTNTVTVVMTNSGSTTNGGIVATTNTFLIGIVQTNHAPVIVGATNRTILENATNGTASIQLWDYDIDGTNLVLNATSLETNIATVSVSATNTPGASNVTFTITYVPVTNQNGAATIQLVGTEGALSTTNTFVLTVIPVTQPPRFTLQTNLLLVGEETVAVTNVGFATNLAAGPTNQLGQTWAFNLSTATTNSTNASFAVLPAMATNGTLTFKPLAHTFGTNTVTVVMTNSGSTTNGGIVATTNTFLIGIVQTNHAPTIVGATNRTILENATNGTASIQLWDYDIDGTNLVLNATPLETNIATVSVSATNTPGASNVTFTITYVPVTNQNGAATIQLVGTEGALSTTNTFVLTVIPVTQPPRFTLQTNLLLVGEETVAVTNVGFATNLAAGPTNQLGQTWAFNLSTATTNSTNASFAVLPAMATNGTLTFKPLAHTFGTNTVTVVMTNSGSTTNGGIVATTNTFLIGIVQTNHAPTIVGATNRTILENATNGTASIQLWDYDIDGTNLVLNATSLETNIATVSVSATNTPGASNVTFTITYVPVTNQNGAATIQLVGTEGALSTTNTFVLTVIPVTQPPRFTLQTNMLLVGEETVAVTNVGFATNLAAGPTNQLGQTWAFNLSTVTTNSTNASFAVLPAMATNGTLTFKPLAHTFGTNTVTVVMTNSGSVTNGGIVATTNTFLIGIVQTNHAPAIVGATNRTILENATNSTASIQLWDYDIDGTNLVLNATSLETNIATVSVSATNTPGASNVTFTITYVAVTNQNGAATIQLVGTEGALSTTNTFVLTVIPVTQPPRFTLQTNLLLVGEETVAVTNVGFATNLAAGPTNQQGQTWAFNLSTATTNSTNANFAVLPAMATNGTLTFKPLAHTFGTNTVTVVMTNSGSTTNGGVVATTNTFLIGIVQTNHAPTIVGATNRTILENATNGTASIQLWDYDIDGTNLVLNATSLETNIATVSVSATNTPGASNVTFTITYVPVTNQNGAATIQLVGTEGALSTTNTFVLTVIPVTQPPQFTFSTNIFGVLENAGVTNLPSFVTNLSAGPTNQLGETWGFSIVCPTTNATNATFAQFPTMTTNGTLSFRTFTNSFGTNTVTVIMTNSGSTTNGGVNVFSNSFQLQVAQVAYPPAFTSGIPTNKTILENQSTNLTVHFVLYDPLTTNFNVSCASSNTNLVVVSVASVGTNATLTLAPVTNQFGTTTISITADDGTLTNSTNFGLTVTFVNQAPSFALALTNITVDEYDVALSFTNAVTNVSAGPTNESNQTVSFTVSDSSPSLFVIPPSVNSAGTLSFTPGSTGGTATIGIKAVDTGGTANGGTNASAIQTLTITIPDNAFAYLTGPFEGLFFNTNAVVSASSGYFYLNMSNNGAFTGYFLNAGTSNNYNGQFEISNSAATINLTDYVLNLTVDTSSAWTETVSGDVSNTVGTWDSTLTSYLAGYSSNFPTSLNGDYLMALPGFAASSNGPTGSSLFSLNLDTNGNGTVTAFMADNTAATASSQLSSGGYYPLYLPLYSGGANGVVLGWLNITGDLTNAVSGTSTLTWFAEPGASTLYASGFTNQALPEAAVYDNTIPDLLSFSSATVVLSGGNLTTPITNSVTISANVVYVDPGQTNGLSLTINRTTGEVSGSFTEPGNIVNSIDGVILQNTTNVVNGYFIGSSDSGSFTLYGN